VEGGAVKAEEAGARQVAQEAEGMRKRLHEARPKKRQAGRQC